jgi:hypothetical protein
MELRHCRPCWRYFEAFESGVRSRLRSDEMCYALVDIFLLLTFSTYAVNEDMRMRGYEIWDVGEDVYEWTWIWNQRGTVNMIIVSNMDLGWLMSGCDL